MKKVFFYTFGCKVNQYDTQALREQMRRQGYEPAAGIKDADVVVINSCSVTAAADRQCRQLARKVMRENQNARVVITGCYAVRAEAELKALGGNVEIVPDQADVVSGKGEQGTFAAGITEFAGHSRAFVKIQDGCDAFCSYCIVPLVRSRLWSKPVDDVVTEVAGLVKRGYPEIVLTGVHLGRYEHGIAAVLRRLLLLEGEFRIRLSSLEMNEVTCEILELMNANADRICSHLHLPLQSGSDPVLSRMNRTYGAADFSRKLDMIRKSIPDAAITTDVIAGFPGETDEQFEETYRFIKDHGFSRVHVFPFSPREGTKAAQCSDQVSPGIVHDRSKKLSTLDRQLQQEYWRRFVGKTRSVIREGNDGVLLTDNYIRLCYNTSEGSFPSGVSKAKIVEISNKPWAVPAT